MEGGEGRAWWKAGVYVPAAQSSVHARHQVATSHPCLSYTGLLLTALVREFLEWSGMEFTIKVFEPEMGDAAGYKGRMELARQLVGA